VTGAARRRGAALAGLAACLSVAACASYGPLPDDLARRLTDRVARDATFVTESATVTITSDALSGEFTGRLAARRDTAPTVRVQLFPDLGGKVLDVLVDARQVVAVMPQAGLAVSRRTDDATLPPYDPLLFVAVSLLESFTPVTKLRVRGARRVDGGVELLLDPTVAGTRVTAIVDDAGAVLHHEIALRAARWRISTRANRVEAHGSGFTLVAAVEERETHAALPSDAFAVPTLAEDTTR
jgi:hypothetical protein